MKNKHSQQTVNPPRDTGKGFALISTITVMSLLLILAVAILNFSTIVSKSANINSAQIQAQANAKVALMMAIGELQVEMGPDMRISAESAIFDTDKDTVEIDGVNQSHWTASYNSWGSWLNAEFEPQRMDGTKDSPISIQETYVDKRSPLFRRWLLSLPENQISNIDAPIDGAGLTDENSVVLVDRGSLGDSDTVTNDQITRAFLENIDDTNRLAWWVGAENHKAKATLADNDRSLAVEGWESAQGGTAEVGVNKIEGFGSLKSDLNESEKVLSQLSISLTGVDKDTANSHFFDITTNSLGIASNQRSGGLKKDINLLFELPNSSLPGPYKFSPGDLREPSIRPFSAELAAKNPKEPGRHFASWTNMRHFYRMYKSVTDADTSTTEGAGNLTWQGYKPTTKYSTARLAGWDGKNHYHRHLILSKLTFIFSLQSVAIPNTSPQQYDCYLVYSPIYTFWNPYNVEITMPNRAIGCLSLPYKILPLNHYKYLNGVRSDLTSVNQGLKQDYGSYFNGEGNQATTFKPGESILFSYRSNGTSSGKQSNFYPGFDPQAIGGDKLKIHSGVTRSQRPGMALAFGDPSGAGGNVWFGNTPGGLNAPFAWRGPAGGNWNPHWTLCMYQHDWFRPTERDTSITPAGSSNVAKWQFSDSDPVPFAFNQFAIKSASKADYESIDWEKDWRCKNWMQAPAYYFGSAQSISNDDAIAHTQRSDNPYAFHFGPMSAADMPKVVPHLGKNSFFGSGSNPVEKITSVAALELPSAPLSSLASFANMRIHPGWTSESVFSKRSENYLGPWNSLNNFKLKSFSYQSGVTGPALGNSFIHPMLPRDDVYRYFNNSVSHDVSGFNSTTTPRDSQAYCDFWDHAFLINDGIWDDYFCSTLADASRPTSPSGTLDFTVDQFISEKKAPGYSRYRLYKGLNNEEEIKQTLMASDGYLKAAQYIVIDGMFNVNSTSVDAWYAIFSGIRERKVTYRDGAELKTVDIPNDKAIALSRFNTATTNLEAEDPENGVTRADSNKAWSGVRFLDDDQLRKLAEECVKQVKLRGPFLNYSEFINRRLSNDELGIKGALQSAIDYDDDAPDSKSINYRYKSDPDYMIEDDDVDAELYATKEAATGSRFTGIPGYVLQSDLLQPISNNLSVRDDTFRIRAYGEVLDSADKVIASAWCEAIIQRYPEYVDTTNTPEIPAQLQDAAGKFTDNPELTAINKKFGRAFRIQKFRWLNRNEL